MGLWPRLEQISENISPQSHGDTEKIQNIEKPQDEKPIKGFLCVSVNSVVNDLQPCAAMIAYSFRRIDSGTGWGL
jgi:hypothetical protein